jgi:hypothetical protein
MFPYRFPETSSEYFAAFMLLAVLAVLCFGTVLSIRSTTPSRG